METLDIVKAILHIKPNAQFSFQNNDYATIKWDVLEGDAPSWTEIESAHLEIQETEAQFQEQFQAKRAATLAKLEALGLNQDDLRALGL